MEPHDIASVLAELRNRERVSTTPQSLLEATLTLLLHRLDQAIDVLVENRSPGW